MARKSASKSKRAVAEKVRAYRARQRAQGLRPVQIWIRDTRDPNFAKEAHRESLAVAKADRQDKGLAALLDSILTDLEAD